MNIRNKTSQVSDLFIKRWSSRMFTSYELSDAQLDSLFEAARWSPSCFNEQPWFFVIPKGEQEKEAFMQLLMPANQEWVKDASLLCYVIARRHFNLDGRANRHYAFDSGAAWVSLALQAETMGLSAHAMGGFNHDASYEVLKVDKEKYEVMAAIAIGKPSSKAVSEERTQRKPLARVYGTSLKTDTKG